MPKYFKIYFRAKYKTRKIFSMINNFTNERVLNFNSAGSFALKPSNIRSECNRLLCYFVRYMV